MLFTRTFIVGIDPCFQFGGTQQPIRFRDGPLAMNPFRFNRVEPRTFARQVADDDAHARSPPLDLLIMVAYPGLHGPAAVPETRSSPHSRGARSQTGATSGRPAVVPAAAAGHNRPAPW